MTRHQAQHDPLFDELTALTKRVELAIGDRVTVMGFRSNGALSIYVGHDFVIGCSALHEIRRIFLHGALFRAEGGKVARLHRENDNGRVHMRSEILEPSEELDLVGTLRWHIEMLVRALAGDRYQIVACEPEGEADEILQQIRKHLHGIIDQGFRFAPSV